MRFPELTEYAVTKDNNEEFGGYNHNIRNADGEWYDQKNMTTDYYPVASPRNKRALQIAAKGYRDETVSAMHIDISPKSLAAVSADGNLYTLHQVRRANNDQDKGAWLEVNGGIVGINNLHFGVFSYDLYKDENIKSICSYEKYDENHENYGYIISLQLYLNTITSEDPPGEAIILRLINDKEKFDFQYCNYFKRNEAQHWVLYKSVATYNKKDAKKICDKLNNIIDGDNPKLEIENINDAIKANILTDPAVAHTKDFLGTDEERTMLRMGSYICVFPDGVVYESEKIKDLSVDDNNPKFPIGRVTLNRKEIGMSIDTVIKTTEAESGYKTIGTPVEIQGVTKFNEYDGVSYRVSDGIVQRYIEDKGTWVAQPTYVQLTPQVSGHVGDILKLIRQGDTIEIMIGGTDAYQYPKYYVDKWYGVIQYDSNKTYEKGQGDTSLVVRCNVVEVLNNAIIVDGFLGIKWKGRNNVASGFKVGDYLGTKGDSYSSLNDTYLDISRKIPDISILACESQNRIWCCSKDGHEIYASALGNPYSYYNYSGLSTDSYAVNVGTEGEFTGCVNYLGRPLFFKENALHVISGSYPTNLGNIDGMSYAVNTTTQFKGVEKGSHKSLAIIDGVLYYKSPSGVVAYDGASTVIISDALGKEKYKNAIAGAFGNKYYISMEDENGNRHLFVYNTRLNMWAKEDNINVVQFVEAGSDLLLIDDTGAVYSMSDENILNLIDYEKEGDIEWSCETGNFGYSIPNNKYLSRFQVRLQLTKDAKASIYVQYDSDGVWHKKGDMESKGTKSYIIPIVPRRCDHMKIKLEGKGDVKLISIAKLFEEGGDIV